MRKTPKKTKKTKSSAPAGKQRLQKILAASGIDSRRKCETLILEHAVSVNGEIVNELPAFADPEKDDIRVDGQRIKQTKKVYFLLNKPKGVICTSSDPQKRQKAVDLVDCPERVVCVGRLDIDTTGAIILTNDSELVNHLTHPKYELPKTYQIVVRGRVEGADVEKLKKGVWLAEGKTQGAAVKIIRRSHAETTLQVVISQGLNRQIRRMFSQLGFKVKLLKRTQIGDIVLKGIAAGNYKRLTKPQLAYLKRATGMES
jgi:23S rRNA pseudouridine2605 synthase